MHKILLTTVHPAPYIDKWINGLNTYFETTIIYNYPYLQEKAWKNFKGYPGFLFSDLSLIQLYKIIKSNDLIIVGGWTNWDCLKTILLSWLLKREVGIFTDYPFHQKKYADFFKKIFLYRIINYIFCATQSTSEFIEKKYKSAAHNKTKLFPYAVEMQPLTPIRDTLYKENSDTIDILIASNFVYRKGYETLFNAFKLLSQEKTNKKYRIKIAGHGPLLEKYKKIALEINSLDIHFYGWVNPEDYNNLIKETDVYIHPSYEEPFGIPPLDAMFRKKIVIVSDGVKSTDSIIKNGYNGYVYPAHDANKLAKIILNLDKKQFDKIGENAHKCIEKHYSIEVNINSIKSCFK